MVRELAMKNTNYSSILNKTTHIFITGAYEDFLIALGENVAEKRFEYRTTVVHEQTHCQLLERNYGLKEITLINKRNIQDINLPVWWWPITTVAEGLK